jgi:hypothetical protein
MPRVAGPAFIEDAKVSILQVASEKLRVKVEAWRLEVEDSTVSRNNILELSFGSRVRLVTASRGVDEEDRWS